MYCPQCGRGVELDGETRFCRYCGLALAETRENLLGFSEVKREGYKFINLSFVLVAVLFWINYFGLIPWTSFWGGNFLLILIFGFIFGLWFMGNWVVDKPAKYVKQNESPELAAAETNALPSSRVEPASARVNKTAELIDRPSIADETTRELSRDE